MTMMIFSYNPLERREASKGGKDVSKKSAPSQSSSTKPSAVAPKAHNARRNEAPSSYATNQSVKTSKPPPIQESVYEQQITELKLSVDSLEKERDFYFGKLRDIEILCQCPEMESLPLAGAIKRILYAAEDDPSIVEEAQAMILNREKELSPISETEEEEQWLKRDNTQKRKNIDNVDVDLAASTTLSPRQRISDASDVHCSW